MKKLTLNPEQLDVVQFQVGATSDDRGTVQANAASTQWYTAPCLFCPNQPATRTCGC